VWRGSLLLAEYVLSRASNFVDTVGCELGAGTGVAGIALACAGARRVFITDVGPSVLDLCQVRKSLEAVLR
jgi:predicted nicotinamide N-methyase